MENEKQVTEFKENSLVVFGENGTPVVTSLKVAEKFGKQHSHVLDAVNKLECSEKFRQSNFRPANYLDRQKKSRAMYEITRDGFAFLAMGFTGKKAAEFKEKFIAAFNKMEWALMMKKQAPAPVQNTGISVDALSKVLVDVNTNMFNQFGTVLKTVLDGHAKTIDSLLKYQGKDTDRTNAIIESATKNPSNEWGTVGDIFETIASIPENLEVGSQSCGFGQATAKKANMNKKYAIAEAEKLAKKEKPIIRSIPKSKYYTVFSQIDFIEKHFDSKKSERLNQLIGKHLKQLSRNMSYPTKHIYDDQETSAGLYHEDVINAFKENVEKNRQFHFTHNIAAYLKTTKSFASLRTV